MVSVYATSKRRRRRRQPGSASCSPALSSPRGCCCCSCYCCCLLPCTDGRGRGASCNCHRPAERKAIPGARLVVLLVVLAVVVAVVVELCCRRCRCTPFRVKDAAAVGPSGSSAATSRYITPCAACGSGLAAAVGPAWRRHQQQARRNRTAARPPKS
jgi:hypothetical protein